MGILESAKQSLAKTPSLPFSRHSQVQRRPGPGAAPGTQGGRRPAQPAAQVLGDPLCEGQLYLEPTMVAATGGKGWAQLHPEKLLVWETDERRALWMTVELSRTGQVRQRRRGAAGLAGSLGWPRARWRTVALRLRSRSGASGSGPPADGLPVRRSRS